MSAPVDVLAVLSRRANELTRKYGADNDLAAVRAAVAELIAAANLAHEWIHEAGLRHRDMPNVATLSRLSCALDRVRGES